MANIVHLVRLRDDIRANVRALNGKIRKLNRQIKRAEKKQAIARKVEQEIRRKERDAWIMQLHRRGRKFHEIASDVGLGRERVYAIVRDMQSAEREA